MAANRVRSQYDALEQIERSFTQEQAAIARIRGELERHKDVLEGGDWQGRSARAFYAEMNGSVMPAVKNLIRALEQSAQVTRRIRVRMSRAEADAANALRPRDAANGAANVSPGSKGAAGGADDVVRGADDVVRGGDDRVGKKIGGIPDVTFRPTPGHVFVDDSGAPGQGGVSPNDVDQGQLGDCYYLSALGALAAQQPDVIRNMIRANADGTYTVTFHDDAGKAVDVRVTSDLPYSKDGRMPFAQPGDAATDGQPELWVPILEKAYAQYKGGYDEIGDGGLIKDAMQTITGVKPKAYDPDDLSFKDFNQAFKEGRAIGLSSLPSRVVDPGFFDPVAEPVMQQVQHPGFRTPYDNGTLIAGHAYYVIGVDEATQTVQVKNPWGWNASNLSIPYKDLQGQFREVAISGTK